LIIIRDGQLSSGTQDLNLKGNLCQVRSLEFYDDNRIFKANSIYEIALKNYIPANRTWVIIYRNLKQKMPYLTLYCFNVDYDLTYEQILEDLNKFITFDGKAKVNQKDWIESASSFLFWRPTLSLANARNKYNGSFKAHQISVKRNHRSVLKFNKKASPIKEDEPAEQKLKGCQLSTLYKSHHASHNPNGRGFHHVGEYKIVNLDFIHEKGQLLLVGRNFFKNPMNAVIHCFGIDHNFTVADLERELDGVLTLHRKDRLHW